MLNFLSIIGQKDVERKWPKCWQKFCNTIFIKFLSEKYELKVRTILDRDFIH